MDKQRIKQFFNWITTVKVNQMALVEYSDVTTYLKQSEKVKRIEEAENYLYEVIRDNNDLRGELKHVSDLNKELVYEVLLYRKNLLKAIK